MMDLHVVFVKTTSLLYNVPFIKILSEILGYMEIKQYRLQCMYETCCNHIQLDTHMYMYM